MSALQETLGVKNIAIYWTFGRYDAIRIFEAPDEKVAMKGLIKGFIKAPDYVIPETMLALRREAAEKLLD